MSRPVAGRWLSIGALALFVQVGWAGQDPVQPQGPHEIRLVVGRSESLEVPWPAKGASLTDPAVADVQVLSPRLLIFSGKAPGTTDAFVWGEDGQSQAIQIVVVADLQRLQEDLAELLPGSQLKLSQTQKAMLVSGTLARAEQAENLLAYMEALGLKYVDLTSLPGVQQVQVKVRLAEVSRTAIRSLGVNGFRTGTDFFFGSNLGGIAPTSIGPAAGASATGNTPFAFTSPPSAGPAVTLFAGFPGSDLELFFQALADNQFLRILSEPNLVALSGEEASFLAGGEFPIPAVQTGAAAAGAGGSAITIEFKEFGVGLRFRPVVLGDGAIRLQVSSEVSELSDVGGIQISGFQIPSVVTRRASTTLEMKTGQTFAMAGLLSENANAQASRVPYLGSIPFLGTLFRSVRYRRGETELLVLVTASLVEPLSQLDFPPLPGTERKAPDDWELYGEGKLEGGLRSPAPGAEARWAESLGLASLKGSGAWASYEFGPARGTASAEAASASASPDPQPQPPARD
ncbi:MAG TPA: type II and III secretion system protein family protein [Planctomycetota bacterium]|nr:type II and III secretion system protein family protein [Planctomycetota bacterium]